MGLGFNVFRIAGLVDSGSSGFSGFGVWFVQGVGVSRCMVQGLVDSGKSGSGV